MAKSRNQKLKTLYILDILKHYSDEEHPLNSSDIAKKLAEYGIEAERKSIYDDIYNLEQYGCDIIKTSSPKQGWFIGEREFEVPEIYLLCDAVRSARFISAKKTRELLEKLHSMLSEAQAKRSNESVFFSLGEKCSNEELYYSIDTISTAIKENRQIKLTYSSRSLDTSRQTVKNSKEMVINPYALTWQDDYYYLIGNHSKYDNLIHLRLDRISKVSLLETIARHFSEVSEYKEAFDIADYTAKLFSMYSGELTEIELCCRRDIAEQVFDRFSEEIFIKNISEEEFSFSVKAAVSEALVTWVMNYGEKIKVIKPKELQQRIIQRAQTVLKNYQ